MSRTAQIQQPHLRVVHTSSINRNADSVRRIQQTHLRLVCSAGAQVAQIPQAALVAQVENPQREETSPEERRWQLEWERRNVED